MRLRADHEYHGAHVSRSPDFICQIIDGVCRTQVVTAVCFLTDTVYERMDG
ncbi:hypothetical protein GPY44_24440 [Photorhabdus laumondii subsp. laumondii]|nr:hypothetical protein [Photorhabdus laumondii subsp. laumondii]